MNVDNPVMLSKVLGMAESGQLAEEIGKTLAEENYLHDLEKLGEYESDKIEYFPNEIKLIAQALCFRVGNFDDMKIIHKVLNAAYFIEIKSISDETKQEVFRNDTEAVTYNFIESLFDDKSLKWLVVEAPNGHGIENDGVMLGACCYSVDGLSKRNGDVEGLLGSIRMFGILPRYHGLCIGLRLLQRVELEMRKAKCVRSMVSIPSPRITMQNWIQRRGYIRGGSISYPSNHLKHNTIHDNIDLIIFLRSLNDVSLEADGKDDGPTKILITKVNGTDISNEVFDNNKLNDDISQIISPQITVLPNTTGKVTLPPHWRLAANVLNQNILPVD